MDTPLTDPIERHWHLAKIARNANELTMPKLKQVFLGGRRYSPMMQELIYCMTEAGIVVHCPNEMNFDISFSVNSPKIIDREAYIDKFCKSTLLVSDIAFFMTNFVGYDWEKSMFIRSEILTCELMGIPYYLCNPSQMAEILLLPHDFSHWNDYDFGKR